jgi:hypothetical protein
MSTYYDPRATDAENEASWRRWEARCARKHAERVRARTLCVHLLANGPVRLSTVEHYAYLFGIDPELCRFYTLSVEYDGETYLALDCDGMAALMRYRDEGRAT